jgi:CSLREA domain-containing protein
MKVDSATAPAAFFAGGRRIAWGALFFAATAAAGGATITVNSIADVAANDGQCTLREAIIAANTNTASGALPGECAAGVSGLDTIGFSIPGAGVHTIAPTSALPAVTEVLTIDGYTQPGASANTNAFPGPLNTVLLIELNGASSNGLVVTAAGTTIRGLVINRVTDGISITTNNVTVAGNFIGTNPAGTAAQINAGRAVDIGSGNNNVVGGPAAADRNLLSGNNQGGVFVGIGVNDGNLIQGNFIGPDVTGTVSLGSSTSIGGVTVRGSSSTNTRIIGNLISGNAEGGIEDESTGGVIQGNLIGTQRDGTSPLPNGNFGGVLLSNGAGGSVTVGGSGPGQPNVIAFNGGFGVIFRGGTGNQLFQNSIYGNANLGISFDIKAAPEPNDNCDADSGPNNRQNYPVITSAVIAAGNVTISGTLNSTASTDFHLEFFSNVACDPTGNGQGQTFLGSASVTTPVGNCNVSFGPLVFPVSPGQTVFTATANDFQNTSEFSACFPTGAAPPPTATPTATPTGVPPATATPTPTPTVAQGGGGGPTTPVPTLSPGVLVLFGLALVLSGIVLMRRLG